MKIAIRNGIFETNSSSTHALAYGYKSDIDKFMQGELLILQKIYEDTIQSIDDNSDSNYIQEEFNKLNEGILYTDEKYELSIYPDLGLLSFIKIGEKIPKGYCAMTFEDVADCFEYLESDNIDVPMNDTPNDKIISTISFYGRDG